MGKGSTEDKDRVCPCPQTRRGTWDWLSTWGPEPPASHVSAQEQGDRRPTCQAVYPKKLWIGLSAPRSSLPSPLQNPDSQLDGGWGTIISKVKTSSRKSPECPHQRLLVAVSTAGWVLELHAGLCSQVPNNLRNVGGLGSESKQGVSESELSDLLSNCRASLRLGQRVH